MPEPPSILPKCSIVIPTLDRAKLLSRVLDLLERQDCEPEDFDVVVGIDAADASGADLGRALAGRAYQIESVRASKPGVSAARNAAVGLAQHPIVLFIGDDMLPSRGLVRRHLEQHRRHPAVEVAVVGHVRWSRELRRTAFMRWLDDGRQFDFGTIRGSEAGWWHFYAANGSLKRKLFTRVGGFDEAFRFGYEEMDLALRLHRQGLRVLYQRDAVVDHLHPPTVADWQRRMAVVARAERQFVDKHPDMDPYFFPLFKWAATLPPARGRGVALARFIPKHTPLLGRRVWGSADSWFAQQLAPAFLEEWTRRD